ncbi:hypothetical protein CSOJ01_15430 [Colletotrichum sojae]|uniref:Uncharacterized protein n=1 Tax=Colletotrichum sojae TaxID=2175907 RepID=A0A8H6MIM6_9PEZI|nr:hypothetical protein CSOJ01_15430 [Colletotrichum sojae]
MDWDVDMDDVADGFAPPILSIAEQKASSSARISHSSEVECDTESATLAPRKVYIKGLETFTTDSIKTYVKDHYGPVDRVEWIDDNSANLVFASDFVAQEALKALGDVEIADVTQLPLLETIPAKAMVSNPEVNLQIRFAVLSDRKAPGAAQRSRFYLLHPEFDPEERRRNETRNRYRDRARSGRHGRDGRDKPERGRSVEHFDAGMYDDDDATLADREIRSRQRQRRSWSRESDPRKSGPFTQRNQEKELFPSRTVGGGRGQRDRSASPMRDSDGYTEMDTEASRAGTANNRERASGIRGRLARDNRAKELFPSKGPSACKTHMDLLAVNADEATRLMQVNMSVGSGEQEQRDLLYIRGEADQKGSTAGFAIKGAASANVKELFPGRFGAGNTGKELFVDRIEGRGKRRQKAEDLFS